MVNQQERPSPKPLEVRSMNCCTIEETTKHLRNSQTTWSPKDHTLCVVFTMRNSDFWKVCAHWALEMLKRDHINERTYEYFSNIWIVLLTMTTFSSTSLQEMEHVIIILLFSTNKNRWPESILIHLVPTDFKHK